MGGWGNPGRWQMPAKPKPLPVEPDPQTPDPQFPDEGVDMLRAAYSNLRWECAELEAYIEQMGFLHTEHDLKRLDKAVTVMKVGFKILKQVARKRRVTAK